jgi:hypothetical protein
LIAAGEADKAKVILQTVNDAILELEKYLLPSPGELKPPATRPTSQPVQASTAGAGILLALSILQNWGKVQPVVEKLIKGEELTPEERALAERNSAAADARADRLDAEAADELRNA